MKKIFLAVLAIALFPFSGNAQSAQRYYTALFPNPGGENYVAVIPNASVYVCQYNDQIQCTTPIGIYSDTNLNNPIVQPLLADGSGVYSYYIQAGTQVIEKVCAPYDQCSNYAVQVGDKVSGGGGGTGTVTNVDCGNLNPIFGCSVSNPTTTPLLSFTLDTAQSLGFLGNVANTTGPPSYTTLVAGANITLTPNTGVTPNTLTIAASGGGGSGCNISTLSDTWVLSVHPDTPTPTCYGSVNFTWDDATGDEDLIIGDLNTISGTVQTYLMGERNNISTTGSPLSGTDNFIYAIGYQNTLTDLTTSGNVFTDAYTIGYQNSLSASGSAAGMTHVGQFGYLNKITSTTANGVFGTYVMGVRNTIEDVLAPIDEVEIVGNLNDINGAASTAQIFGHLNTLLNVSYNSPQDVNQVVAGSQNLAVHTGGNSYSNYFEIFGHENYEHDCYDCIAVGSGVEVSTNSQMGIGMSRIPELRFTPSNVQRTPLNMALPAPINTAQGLTQTSITGPTTCTVTFTGGTGAGGGTGQVYFSNQLGFVSDYSIQITNGGSYSTPPTGGTLSGTGCSGSISVNATLLTVQACSSSLEGSFAAIADSTVNTWGSTITGGGTNHVFGYCDGTNWTVAAK